MMMLQARNVVAEDDAFLFELFIATRMNEFLLLALDHQQLYSLLHMQYEAQKKSYQQKFPQAKHEIIYYEGLPIGRMMTGIESGNIHLIDISLLPDFRGKGYGTKLLKQLQSTATNQRLSVTLHVLQGNPARSRSITVAMNPSSLSTVGGDQAHDNMQPYLPVHFCIAIQGIFPTRN